MHMSAYHRPMEVEWDAGKARANLAKHGVDLADAATALSDTRALTRPDPDAVDEERFVSLGMDARGQLLLTVFTYREDTLRVISSRKASRAERHLYGEE